MPQKSQRTSSQCGCQETRSNLVQRKADGHQANGRNSSNPCGKAIQTIKPINRIGDAHEPNHRGQQTEPI
jgi:hypothetical protein